jgi:glutaredoxin
VIALTIYSRQGCHLCTDMKRTVERIVREFDAPARIEEINIAGDPELEARYGQEIPVLLVNGRKAAKFRVTDEELTRILRARTGEAG